MSNSLASVLIARRNEVSKIIYVAVILWFLSVASSIIVKAQDSVTLRGPYLGLTAPIDGAQVFAPGIVSTEEKEIMYGFLSEGRRLVFGRMAADFKVGDTELIYVMELVDGQWTGPSLSDFPTAEWYKNFTGVGVGEEMVIAKERPRVGPDAPFVLDLWSVQRTDNDWSEPRKLAINTDRIDTWPSVAADGDLYFFSNRDGGFGGHDIYRSWQVNGVYTVVENLGPVINTDASELDPLIAPDESFLIFCSKARGGFGGQDLFISFQMPDGSWHEADNMGETINTAGDDMRPVISADGKALFYTSDVSGVLHIYWVDASFIEHLRPSSAMTR